MSQAVTIALVLRAEVLEGAADHMMQRGMAEVPASRSGPGLNVRELRQQAAEYRALAELIEDPLKAHAQLDKLKKRVHST